MKNQFFLLLFITVALLGSSCQKTQDDLCQGIICLNGGTFINGECDCPPQWTGPSCNQEKTPIKLRVGNIRLTKFPPVDAAGGGWDLLDGPDVYIEIMKDNNVLFSSAYVENLLSQFEFPVNFEFSDPTATYVIRVYDYDELSDDDFMGGISFTPYTNGENFPTTKVVDCPTCTVSFELKGLVYFH